QFLGRPLDHHFVAPGEDLGLEGMLDRLQVGILRPKKIHRVNAGQGDPLGYFVDFFGHILMVYQCSKSW
ncbi:MAG: hypothetical protein Q8O74_05825, partial [bacterium]|nr:hypothetical protein [bacterium]